MQRNILPGMKKQNGLALLLIFCTIVSHSAYSYTYPQKPSGFFRMPAHITQNDFVPACVIFKVKETFRYACSEKSIELSALNQYGAKISISKLEKIFPEEKSPVARFNALGVPLVDLSLVYELRYQSQVPLEKVINNLYALGLFEYVQPRYIQKPLYAPNDPLMGNQNFLNQIQAPAAWNMSKGDTNVVIGIIDTGTDPNHPDLAGNLKKNYADPIDGLDNDNDGFIDNFSGWDLGENDNDATVNGNSHGSHVTGCAAAVTDNAVGVASPGFNCKFLPVKISDASGVLTKGYEGIKYAADHGCSIINCSWGGSAGGVFEKSIIDYASLNKNCLVVAAAGNNNADEVFYPAAYDYVMAIASITGSDAKSSFSNYGYFIDVCAPGSMIYSTWYNDTYSTQSGTSMASPVAAGGAALVKSHFPTYSGLQVAEQLRISADNIYNKSGNSAYAGKLGTGRINLFKALTISSPSVRVSNLKLTDGNDNAFVIGDTIQIEATFTNYLNPTNNLSIQLASNSANITILNPTLSVGIVNTLSSFNNTSTPFLAVIKPGTPLNDIVSFTFSFVDGSYKDAYAFDATLNVDYINMMVNDIQTTITSKGRIAYNGTDQSEGLGFRLNNSNSMLYEMGLMIGKDANHVSDNMRGAVGGQSDDDFVSSSVVTRQNQMLSAMDLSGVFNDNNASVSKLNVSVRHKAYAWANVPDNRYIIVEYCIKNKGASVLNSLYAGIFADWDIMNYNLNLSAYDPSTKMGYVWSNEPGGLYGGTKLLTHTNAIDYAFDNDGSNSSINLYNGFPSSAKYKAMTGNRLNAGQGDVSNMVSTGPFTLPPNDSVCVAFALLADYNLNNLLNSAVAAQNKYDQYLLAVNEMKNEDAQKLVFAAPNPVRNTLDLHLQQKNIGNMEIEIYNTSGQIFVKQQYAERSSGIQTISFDVSDWPAGMYFYRITSSKQVLTDKIMIVK